jgi:hypothetical protein
MTLIETEAVTDRDWIFRALETDANAELINCELPIPFVMEIDDRAIAN